MTEDDWNRCANYRMMLGWLRKQGCHSARKARLFACACCRAARDLFERDELLPSLLADVEELADAQGAGARDVTTPFLIPDPYPGLRRSLGHKDPWVSAWNLSSVVVFTVSQRRGAFMDCLAEPPSYLARVLIDVFGNPFRPTSLASDWLTPTVLSLAAQAYSERQLPSGHLDNDRLAVLADALEEAGCENHDILGHLRGPGPHVRGCWALDLVLGKD